MIESERIKWTSIAYIGATLPTLSETFVSNELIAVRATGMQVVPVSVFPPRLDGLDEELRVLASAALIVYSAPSWRSAATEILVRPVRSLRTLGMAFCDVLTSRDATTRARFKLPAQAMASLGLARKLRSAGVGHIHAHMANTPTTLAMYAAAQLDIGFSFTGHANDLFVHRTLLPEKLTRAAFVACISRWHREFYRRFADLPDSRLPVIRCGVDVAQLAPDASATADRQVQASLRILSVGRLVPKKGMDVLIRAIGQLENASGVECAIIGDGPMRDELERLIKAEGLESRVQLLGALPNEEVLKRVRTCDVFVLACRRDAATGDQDGIPVSLMEAMAVGKCVITSNLDPITELVVNRQTGLCVPERDASALARAITHLATDSRHRSDLADAGQQHVRHEFDRRANAQLLASLFLVATHGPRTTSCQVLEDAVPSALSR